MPNDTRSDGGSATEETSSQRTAPCQGCPSNTESASEGGAQANALTRAEGLSGLVISDITRRHFEWVPHFDDGSSLANICELLAAASDIDTVPRGEFPSIVEVSPALIRVRNPLNADVRTQRRDFGYGKRRTITEWTPKSRSAMTARLATLDYSQMGWSDQRPPALITLTYPGDWERLVPTARDAKRHLTLFRKRYERAFGQFRGIWKMEFQRRGAPHFHIFCVPPSSEISSAFKGRRNIRFPNELTFREWLSRTWTEIVAPTDSNEYDKHLKAGTGIDYAFGYRTTDTFLVAAYFSKHQSAAMGWKEYQHTPPEAWVRCGSIGRFWGYWGLQPLVETAEISTDDALYIVRTLRRWWRANSSPARVRVWRTHTATGERYQRTATRRRKRLKGKGGFLVTADSVRLATQLSRALTSRNPTQSRDRKERRTLP